MTTIIRIGGHTPYDIRIGHGLLSNAAPLAALVRGHHALILTDGNVAPLYADTLETALRLAQPALRLGRLVLPPGEQSKTLKYFSAAIEALAALGATRDACIFALGGGVVGDLAGFAAACWMRGIDCVQLPTTVLAMVDSSVGGKTAVDIPQGKNLVGAFHTPRAVVADTATLSTLPIRELRAGLAEVIKYAALGDALFMDWLEAERAHLLAGDPETLAKTIARSCEHKAALVQHDPLEQGERALLNLGHTFGHAIEAQQGYSGGGDGNLNHGEAVAVGMMLAARLSTHLGMAPAEDADRLHALVRQFGLPTAIPTGLSPADLLARMRLDKKNPAGKLRLVLWKGIGRAVIVPEVDESEVLAVLANG